MPLCLAAAIALVGCTAAPEASITPAPVPTVTVTVEATVTVTVEAEQTPSQDLTLESSSPEVPEEEELREVDSERFRSDGFSDRYSFVSPSGNLECAISGMEDVPIAGCQAWSLVDNLPDCDDPMATSSPAIDFYRGEPAEAYCISDGAFVAYSGQTLQHGEQLRVRGVTCTSRHSGVECRDDRSGRGFVAAKAGFVAVG